MIRRVQPWEAGFALGPAELTRLNELLDDPEEDLDDFEAGGDADVISEPPADLPRVRLVVDSVDAILWTLETAWIETPEPPSLAALLGARERAVTRWRLR